MPILNTYKLICNHCSTSDFVYGETPEKVVLPDLWRKKETFLKNDPFVYLCPLCPDSVITTPEERLFKWITKQS